MFTNDDIQKLIDVFATKQDLERMEEKMAIKESMDLFANKADSPNC